jgi:uncharacterized paraquat-inducible protein A
MEQSVMARYLASLLSLLLAAFSFGPSFAHVLESLPRLRTWPPELWRDATVFHGQFVLFLVVGAPLDVAAILASLWLTWTMRHEQPTFHLALIGFVLLAVALAVWFARVSPANTVLATWHSGAIPADFDAVRWRWESGHMMVATLKALGLLAICLAVLGPRRPARQEQP